MSWSKLCLSGRHEGWWSLKGQTISAITLCHKCHFNKSSPRRGWIRSYFTCSTITFRSFHATMLIPEDKRAWTGPRRPFKCTRRSPFQQELGILAPLCSSQCFSENRSFLELFFFFFFFPLWQRDRSWRIYLNDLSEGKPLVFLIHPSKFMQ